jgi:hypothetical protein
VSSIFDPFRLGNCWRAAMKASFDALAPLVAGLGRGRRILDLEGVVGVGLEPDGLQERSFGRVVRVARAAVVDRHDPRRPSLDQCQAGVRGDAVEPGAKRASSFEARQPAPGSEQGLLEGVLGVCG